MKKFKELADNLASLQERLHAAHAEGHMKCYVEELAEIVGCLIAEVSPPASTSKHKD